MVLSPSMEVEESIALGTQVSTSRRTEDDGNRLSVVMVVAEGLGSLRKKDRRLEHYTIKDNGVKGFKGVSFRK